MLDTLGIAIAGFSAVSAAILFFSYVVLIDVPNKSRHAILSCAVLLAALIDLQVSHLLYFRDGIEPLGSSYYRLGLFTVPASFYFFGRWAILPSESFRPVMLGHLLPIPLLLALPLNVALPILFLTGAGYSVWLGRMVYSLRAQRKQFQFEFSFFIVMSVLAVAVVILGFSIPYIDDAWFYYFYTGAIGLGFAIMTVALIVNPDLLGEISDAARAKYSNSTLRDVDVGACLQRLDSLMTEAKIYQNEGLTLGTLAQALDISGHQLSELINSRLGIGFAKYIRERRVEAAKALLIAAPAQSILSVSMETGFKSQSSFYAAFKEVTGQSPGDYRKMHTR